MGIFSMFGFSIFQLNDRLNQISLRRIQIADISAQGLAQLMDNIILHQENLENLEKKKKKIQNCNLTKCKTCIGDHLFG